MTTLNNELARQGAETGMLLAAAHAERVREGWNEEALSFFRLYASSHQREPFLTEDVRAWAEKMGFESPPDNRAWGAVARRAALQGLIRKMGYAAQKSATCHNSPKTLWAAWSNT